MTRAQYDFAGRVAVVTGAAGGNVCRFAVPAMRRAGSGRIVNVASLAGKEGTPNASAYSAAKAGVDEVADLAPWLCPDSCTFSTGAIFDFSGGRATY